MSRPESTMYCLHGYPPLLCNICAREPLCVHGMPGNCLLCTTQSTESWFGQATEGAAAGASGAAKTGLGTADCTIESVNVRAFLRLLRFAEHKKDDDSVYYTMFGGSTFTDTSKHPNKPNKRWGKVSTAAGAYQILVGTWNEAKKEGIVSDFSPAAQDKIAFWKLKTRGALKYVCSGNIEKAIPKLRTEWTSLPGAAESDFSMNAARAKYDSYVKMLSE
ncbi:MAG: glycoside hydrolase family 24 protein [Archangium sp.]